MIELLQNIGQAGIAFALLVVAIFYFLKKEKNWSVKESDLENQLKISREENIKLMYKLTNLMDKLFDSSNSNKDLIINELHKLKNEIAEKINNLK